MPSVMYVSQTIRVRPSGNAIFDVAGNSASGMIPMMFMIQTKKNSETRNGRKRSPFLPSCGRNIWSLTNSTPISARFCAPRGTIFGLEKANPKNATTMPAQTSASSIGLVTWKPPMEKIGLKKNASIDGAG